MVRPSHEVTKLKQLVDRTQRNRSFSISSTINNIFGSPYILLHLASMIKVAAYMLLAMVGVELLRSDILW